jgi:hypothetical protein
MIATGLAGLSHSILRELSLSESIVTASGAQLIRQIQGDRAGVVVANKCGLVPPSSLHTAI